MKNRKMILPLLAFVFSFAAAIAGLKNEAMVDTDVTYTGTCNVAEAICNTTGTSACVNPNTSAALYQLNTACGTAHIGQFVRNK